MVGHGGCGDRADRGALLEGSRLNWSALLQQAMDRHKLCKQGALDKLDISRTTVSLVLAGKYPAKTGKNAAKEISLCARHSYSHICKKTAYISASRVFIGGSWWT